MATKALNFKIDEKQVNDMKSVAGVFNMTLTELIKNALDEYIAELKNDPFYRLTANVQEASEEETEEILSEIESMQDDDLAIASKEQLTV